MWIVRSFWSQQYVWEDRVLLAGHKYALGRDHERSTLKSLSDGTLPLLWKVSKGHRHACDIVVGPMPNLPQEGAGAQLTLPPARSETHPITQKLRDLEQTPSSIKSISSSSSDRADSRLSLPPLLNDKDLFYPPDAPELRFIPRNANSAFTLLDQGENWFSEPSKNRDPKDEGTWVEGEYDQSIPANSEPGVKIRHGDAIKIGAHLILIFTWEPMTFGVHDVDPDSMFEQQCRDAFNLGIRTVPMMNYKGSALALGGLLTTRLLGDSGLFSAPTKVAAHLSRPIVTPGFLRKCLALVRSYASPTQSSNQWHGWPAPVPAEDVPKEYDLPKMAKYLEIEKTGSNNDFKSRIEEAVQKICLAGKIEVLSGLTVLYVTMETNVSSVTQDRELIALRALGASLHMLHTTEGDLSRDNTSAWLDELKVGAKRRWQAAAASDPSDKQWLPPENGMLLFVPSTISAESQSLLADVAAEHGVRILSPMLGPTSTLKGILYARCFTNDQAILGKTAADFKALAADKGVTTSLPFNPVNAATAAAQSSAAPIVARSAAADGGSVGQQQPVRPVPRRRRVLAARSESADPDPIPQTAPTQPSQAANSALHYATQAMSAGPPAAAGASVAPTIVNGAPNKQLHPPPAAQRAGSSLRRRVVPVTGATQGGSIAGAGHGLSAIEEGAGEAEPKSARFRKYLEAESRGETMDIQSDLGQSAITQDVTHELGESEGASLESAENGEALRACQGSRTLVLDTQTGPKQSEAERERQERAQAKFQEAMKQAREKVRANEAVLDAEPIGGITSASKTGRNSGRSIAGARGKALQQQQQQQEELPVETIIEDQALEDLQTYREMEMDEEFLSPKLSYVQITQIPMVRRDRQQVGYTPDHNSQTPNFKKFRRAHMQTHRKLVVLELPEANDYGLGKVYRQGAADNIEQEMESGPQSYSQRGATGRTTSGRYRRGGPGAFDESESDEINGEILPAPANIRQTGRVSQINDVTGGAQRRNKRRLALSDSYDDEDGFAPPANQKRRGAAASAPVAKASKTTRGVATPAQHPSVSSLAGAADSMTTGGSRATFQSMPQNSTLSASASAAAGGEGARKRRRVTAAANRAKGDDSDEDAFAFSSSKSRRQR